MVWKNILKSLSECIIDFGKIFSYKKETHNGATRQMKTNVLNGVCKERECFRKEEINIYYILIRLNIHLFVFFMQQRSDENLNMGAMLQELGIHLEYNPNYTPPT